MRVCENGHYIGTAAGRKCSTCGEKVTDGRKISLFLPEPLYVEITADAKTAGESLSVRIIRHLHRDRRDRKRAATSRKAKPKGV
jgi:hypothetical protein